jgi:hypothetical protein
VRVEQYENVTRRDIPIDVTQAVDDALDTTATDSRETTRAFVRHIRNHERDEFHRPVGAARSARPAETEHQPDTFVACAYVRAGSSGEREKSCLDAVDDGHRLPARVDRHHVVTADRDS